MTKEYHKQYYEENKEKIKEQSKQNYQAHKEERKIKDKQYREKNKDIIKEKKKEYRQKHKEEIKHNNKKYRKENQDILLIKSNKRQNIKRKNDPIFALRKDASSMIYEGLKINNGSKRGRSIIQYLEWTFNDLWPHLEKQFSLPENLTSDGYVWMTRENRGKYNPKTWNDKDSTTWTWQLDHIIPHSLFEYATMDCQEFRDCWALSNLRPLSAKQNQMDGATKIRHKQVVT